ncbi:Glutamate receptor 2.7 [Vitis vinifera]|uniref:Glutamate receptor 2.7 n=1 Tax=Vitis vinifera TaxID=29760 RepID=A0A438E5D8_VITVI|nr:Glutamate receptor 2.7 [Vitis vinifera]
MATILLLPGAASEVGTGHMGSIGVIVDNSSRIARNLIKKRRVQAIIGLETWEEASLVVELGSKAHIPIVSLADAAPQWATDPWPFLVRASPEKHLQMKAVAAIIGSWGWRRINVIYEDTNSAGSEIIPFLADALKQVGSESDTLQLSHHHLQLILLLLYLISSSGLKESSHKSFCITNLVHSMNSSVISSMEGVLGVKSFFQKDGDRFQDFNSRFRQKFRSLYPKDDNHEPGIFAVQAYDAVWSVALAMDNNGSTQQLELGFWSEGSGFAKPTNGQIQNSSSMDILGQVFWPGGPTSTPRGWALPTSETPLRIGVPLNATFKQFVSVTYDDGGNPSVSGFSIEVFKAVLKHLNYSLPHEFFPFSGTYDDLVEQVHLKKFDAVVGDTSIVSKRWEQAEFSHPYTEPGLMMIVPEKVETSNRAWLFMKPFTKAMWVLTGAITIYNGFTLWLIERNQNPELMTGSILNQMGTLVCLSFTTLFSMHGGRQHSNLSRLVMVVWLFASLVITNSYTANLTSMLTVQRLEPTVVDVEDLKRDNAIVGCSRRSFVVRYLVDVIGIKMRNIKDITSADQYARDLRSGEVAAAFIEAPYAKIFLAQNCKGFAASGKTYKVGGFGFVFPKGSPILPDISKAVLEVSENGGVSTVCLVIFMARERLTYLYNYSLGHMAIWRLISAVMRSWRSHPRERFSRGISDEESNGNGQHTSMHSPQYFGYRVPWQRNYSSRSSS